MNSPREKITVLLVDDQKLIRDGIRSLLKLADEIEVVGEASDGSEVANAVAEFQPDVILMDISMPIMNGIDAIQHLSDSNQLCPVIVLTTFDDNNLIVNALRAGAKGYLLKDVSLEILVDAIKTVAKGERLVQPAITDKLVSGLSTVKSEFSAPASMEALSEKEKEVLRLMASGCSNREIADALCKSEGTIKNHVSNILAKMGVRDRTRAVLLAIERKLI